jgi:hypothetical protein
MDLGEKVVITRRGWKWLRIVSNANFDVREMENYFLQNNITN